MPESTESILLGLDFASGIVSCLPLCYLAAKVTREYSFTKEKNMKNYILFLYTSILFLCDMILNAIFPDQITEETNVAYFYQFFATTMRVIAFVIISEEAVVSLHVITAKNVKIRQIALKIIRYVLFVIAIFIAFFTALATYCSDFENGSEKEPLKNYVFVDLIKGKIEYTYYAVQLLAIFNLSITYVFTEGAKNLYSRTSLIILYILILSIALLLALDVMYRSLFTGQRIYIILNRIGYNNYLVISLFYSIIVMYIPRTFQGFAMYVLARGLGNAEEEEQNSIDEEIEKIINNQLII